MSSDSDRYFCHQCNQICVPEPPEFVCPTCNDGFIEPVASPTLPPIPNPMAAGMMEASDDSPMNILLRDMLQQLSHASQAPQDPSHSRPNQSGQPWNQQPTEEPVRFISTGSSPDNDSAQPASRSGSSNGAHTHRIHSSNTGHVRTSPFPMLQFPNFQRLRMRSRARGGMRGGGTVQAGNLDGIPTLFTQILSSISGDTQIVGNPGDYAWGPGGLDNIISQLIGQLDGSGPAPAQEDCIDQLPDVYVPKKYIDDKLDCTVCQEFFEEEVKVKQLPCKHYFHTDCIVPWLKLHNSCPICRDPIDGSNAGSQDVEMTQVGNGEDGPEDTFEQMQVQSQQVLPQQVTTQQTSTVQSSTNQSSIHEDDLD